MAKEILSDWPGNEKRGRWFRARIWDLLWVLSQSTEEKKQKIEQEKGIIDKENQILVDEFQKKYWSNFRMSDMGDREIDPIELLKGWDSIHIDEKRTFEDMLMYRKQQLYKQLKLENPGEKEMKKIWDLELERDGVKFILRSNMDDMKFFFNHLHLNRHSVYIELQPNRFNYNNCKISLKILKKFILDEWSMNCCFDLWNQVHRGEYWDKTDYLKELINRFTKSGKSWKISNCVIKANWKEYHSSWNYKYDFI